MAKKIIGSLKLQVARYRSRQPLPKHATICNRRMRRLPFWKALNAKTQEMEQG